MPNYSRGTTGAANVETESSKENNKTQTSRQDFYLVNMNIAELEDVIGDARASLEDLEQQVSIYICYRRNQFGRYLDDLTIVSVLLIF